MQLKGSNVTHLVVNVIITVLYQQLNNHLTLAPQFIITLWKCACGYKSNAGSAFALFALHANAAAMLCYKKSLTNKASPPGAFSLLVPGCRHLTCR
jgi:hypothetical protein